MLRIQTEDYIKALTDSDLIEYARNGQYQPEAIAFAQTEIQRRNLNAQQLQQLQTAADHRLETQRAEIIATEIRPLGLRGRILAFLCGYSLVGVAGGGVFILIARDYLLARGELAKRTDIVRFVLGGFGVAGALFVVFTILCNAQSGTMFFLFWVLGALLASIGIAIFSEDPHPDKEDESATTPAPFHTN